MNTDAEPKPKPKARVVIYRPRQARRKSDADELDAMLANDISPATAQGIRRLTRRLRIVTNL